MYVFIFFFFFFNDTATTEIYTGWYTLSLHDALPICAAAPRPRHRSLRGGSGAAAVEGGRAGRRSRLPRAAIRSADGECGELREGRGRATAWARAGAAGALVRRSAARRRAPRGTGAGRG